MAGSGRKVFTAGEVLRAADVNGYLMDQSVQVYAGTAARGSAIGTATSAGMMSYLSDQSKLQLATGTATWVDVYPQSPFSPNFIINGGMDIAQRGTSFSASGSDAYKLDRWFFSGYGSGQPVSFAQLTDVLPTGLAAYMRVQPTTSNSTNIFVVQALESNMSIPLAGQTVSLSFWYKLPTNFSSTWTVTLKYSTSTDVAAASWITSGTNVVTSSITNASSWTRLTISGTVPSTAKSIGLIFQNTNTTVANAMFDFTGVQLEVGSATTFRRNGNSIQGELAACQRYYYRIGSTAAYSNLLLGMQQSTTESHCTVQPPVTMRVTPSASGTTLAWSDVASFNTAISAISISTTSVYSTFNLYSTYSASGAQYRPGFIRSGASAGYIELSAEL